MTEPPRHLDPRTPVLVGVGAAHDDAEAVELMTRATEAAARDSGAPQLAAGAQRIAVPRGTWSYTDPARIVAARVGAREATTVLADVGVPQQTLINDALAAILRGEADVAIVVGAEAKARAARLSRDASPANAAGIARVMSRAGGAAHADEIDQGGVTPDVHQTPRDEIVSRSEIAAGLWAPVEQYALIESALGSAEHQPLADHVREIAELWARYNAVAQSNPDAAFPKPMDARQLMTFGPTNRPLAFPYGKWHASQWTVDQGAALIFGSVEAVARAGVTPDRWIFPLVGLESSFSLPLTNRLDLHRWPAMRVLGDAAASHLGRSLAACEHAELYSCFPVAVRVQQRELDLSLDETPTITGGMAFAGGPFNNFVLQATVAMARRLREQPGRGLVTTVSGLLTKPGLAVWATEPPRAQPLVADLHEPARRATATVEAVESYSGDAVVAAYTVTYDGMQPTEVIAIVDTSEGVRALARSIDADVIGRGITTGLVGEPVRVTDNRFDL
jgi:acetyl-CoA C-acetyltransferase